MAEAVVEEQPAPVVPPRFYCHICNVEIYIPSINDYTCPICSGGFVEELPEGTPERRTSGSSRAGSRSTSRSRLGRSNSSSLGRRNSSGNSTAFVNNLAQQLATDGIQVMDLPSLLTARTGPNLEITIEPGTRRTNVVSIGGGSGAGSGGSGAATANGSATSSANSSGTNVNVAGGRVRPTNLDRLDNVLLDFLQSLPLTGNVTEFGNSQMFFMGNPADYAWGREGLDTIVTQMLNQMETSGPPPLPKKKIDQIARVAVTADDVERKLQCSVCWEDFTLDEQVRKLPCSHLYHEHCIVPWLNLHGTCPICRKSLSDDDSDEVTIRPNIGITSLNYAGGFPSGSSNIGTINLNRNPNVNASRHSTNCPVHGNRNETGGGAAANTTPATSNSSQTQIQPQQQPSAGTSPTATASPSATESAPTLAARNHVFSFDDDNMNLD